MIFRLNDFANASNGNKKFKEPWRLEDENLVDVNVNSAKTLCQM